MLVTISWIKENYEKFNNLYFGGYLPKIQFKISRSRHSWGFASFRYDFVNSTIIPTCITMSNYYDSPEDVKIQTLLHEMIHIEDYMWHPEHFIKNGRKVHGKTYNAHGAWFQSEANRISNESGYEIAKHVTRDEIGRSCLSDHSLELLENKKDIARLVVASNGERYWMFKTDEYKVDNVVGLIRYQLPEYRKITIYSFDYEPIARRRSCNTKLSGWRFMKEGLMRTLEKYKATTIKSYKI